ncbi:unnamed protein product [Durusdinium trenchii]|uniref:C3H1-type domain-containing protein n=1 Tax=Durusdinium trenchii TaxID=1381693 RepID=A0ABP0SPA9_9DINO
MTQLFKEEVLQTIHVMEGEVVKTLTITMKNGSVDVLEGSNSALPRSSSEPDVRRWVLPGDGPSQADLRELHNTRRCVPCLFFTTKADGCRMGEACAWCHFCTRSEMKREQNRLRFLRRRAEKLMRRTAEGTA